MSYTFPSCLLGTSMIGIRKKNTPRICWTLKIACCSFGEETKDGFKFAFLTPLHVLNFPCQLREFTEAKWIWRCVEIETFRLDDFLMFLQIWGLRPSFFLRPSRWPCHIAAPNGERLKNEFAQSQTLRTKRSQVESDWCLEPQGQPLINGCFNWMIPNLYIENGCFTKHPFINGCLGFQVRIIFFLGENQNIWEQTIGFLEAKRSPWKIFVRVLSKNSAKQPYGCFPK